MTITASTTTTTAASRMDHSRTSRVSTGAARPIARHRGLLLLGIVATGLAASVQYSKIQRERQSSLSDRPNMYPSVDRTGGGI
ncbi:hypothetical protein F5X99DRAFT_27144 [Biscogniauxia marginata]|nr:hypothetical protein F5X99DRAFT_27144 [Biscogniauxia marginata]